MLLTITYTGHNTTDLGYLLYKNPGRPQMVELSHGNAYVFYPEVSDQRTTAALLLDIDPIDLVRGKENSSAGGLFDYVNDRPYVSSSFLSVAIAKVFGTAMSGRGDEHQALADSHLDLQATITMLPCRGEMDMLNKVFEPLGYAVSYESFVNDENFPAWGISKYVNLTIKGAVRLRDLLKHIYVLIPVFDRQKHYWVGEAEVEKLLRNTQDWLPHHPEKEFITSRYLKRLRPLVNMAFERLVEEEVKDAETGLSVHDRPIEVSERKLNLNAQRIGSVVAALKDCRAKSVIDIGCGEGHLLTALIGEYQIKHIAGMDVSHIALEHAAGRLKLDRANERTQERVKLFQSSVTYKDPRLQGYDAACVVEVIEHLDKSRLGAFERVLFEYAKPSTIILTTPNREYNVNYELGEGTMRHNDHRFEWTRKEFHQWAEQTAAQYGYTVRFSEIGDIDGTLGSPTQMGVFTCE